MGQLKALQSELVRVLAVGSDALSSRFWPDGLPARLDVYRNTIHGNAYGTLDADYPLTMRQFSEEDWADLSREFFMKHPPSFWELNQCTADFPSYLAKAGKRADAVDLAIFERADLEAYIHTAEVRPGTGRTNPTAITKVMRYAIFDWVRSKADPAAAPAARPEVLVFYRALDHTGHIRRADPLMLLMMDHFSRPGAELDSLEAARQRLLPGNTVPLRRVLDDLVENDLVLL